MLMCLWWSAVWIAHASAVRQIQKLSWTGVFSSIFWFCFSSFFRGFLFHPELFSLVQLSWPFLLSDLPASAKFSYLIILYSSCFFEQCITFEVCSLEQYYHFWSMLPRTIFWLLKYAPLNNVIPFEVCSLDRCLQYLQTYQIENKSGQVIATIYKLKALVSNPDPPSFTIFVILFRS